MAQKNQDQNHGNQGSHTGNQGGNAGSHGSQGDTSNRGFASMDEDKQREIASKGGTASHQQGVAHEWNSEEASEAGRKGGSGNRSQDDQQGSRGNAGNANASKTGGHASGRQDSDMQGKR